MKKFFAIALMALVVGLGTPATFADGTAESPGYTTTKTNASGDVNTDDSGATVTADGTAESPGITGTAESPGLLATFFIYLDVII